MPEPYDITYLGNPILKKKAQRVKDPTSKEMRDIIARMMATIEQKLGGKDRVAGLAAPQFGESIRMFIFQSDGPRAGENVVPFTIVINPEILSYSAENENDYEACFSLPLLVGREIPRAASIECRYTTVEGEIVEVTLRGFAARAFQHEFDHLEGILPIDHTDDIIFVADRRSIEEVLRITTGKELSDNFRFDPEKGMYERISLESTCTVSKHS